jgi:hypothetical protein
MLLISLLLAPVSISAFLSSSQLSNSRAFSLTHVRPERSLKLFVEAGDYADFSSSNNNNWDVESARRQLEDLINRRGDENSAVAQKFVFSFPSNNPPPLLTAISRLRKTAEIQLLGQLETDVGSAEALNSLWMNERGRLPAEELMKADDLFQQGEASWNQAEDRLVALIDDHGPYWVEPLHRLALLYYMQGKLDEARLLEEMVVAVKPWHFPAISNYVRIAEGQHDVETALQWASRRLPPRLGKRRQEWVEHAVYEAMNALGQDERRLAASYGQSWERDDPWQ